MTTINKDEVLKSSKWLRLFFMVIYVAIVNAIVLPLIIFIVVIQFLFHLFAGRHSSQLEKVSDWLINFLGECLIYLTYKTEQRPFPFNSEEELSSEENIVEASPDEISDDSGDQIDSGNQEPQAS